MNSSETQQYERMFWSRTIDLEKPVRIAALIFVEVVLVAMSFTQLGFLNVGTLDGAPLYLMLVIAPIVMGALMFGPVTGALLGLLGACSSTSTPCSCLLTTTKSILCPRSTPSCFWPSWELLRDGCSQPR